MSHFAVLVIGEDAEKQLEPFNEQPEIGSPYLEFEDEEDENLQEYEEGSTEQVILHDGTMVSPYDERFRKIQDDGFSSSYEVPPELECRKVPFKEIYSTFEEFMKDWHCHQSRDETMGRYGYWRNPNAKWDWYVLGGRWKGFFRLKDGTEGELGESGVFGNQAEEGTADSCRKGDIDFEKMKSEASKSAAETFDKLASIVNGREYPVWKDVREKYEDIDEAREFYNNHPVVIEVNKAQLLGWNDDFAEILKMGKEAYVDMIGKKSIITFAILKDGEWLEKGSMGWWGIVSDEKGEQEWYDIAYKIMMDCPDDTLFSLYDCHI